jgi:hypothetical protein
MAQGNEKRSQKGINSMFVMNHNEIRKAYPEKETFTYTKIIMVYCTQKRFTSHLHHGWG